MSRVHEGDLMGPGPQHPSVAAAPGVQTPDPTRTPDPGKPPPRLPPGGRLPGEVPPAPEEEEIEPGSDPSIRDPERRDPDHLPGGPGNPNPHHVGARR